MKSKFLALDKLPPSETSAEHVSEDSGRKSQAHARWFMGDALAAQRAFHGEFLAFYEIDLHRAQ